jgi:hypothetical protein
MLRQYSVGSKMIRTRRLRAGEVNLAECLTVERYRLKSLTCRVR